MGTLAAGIKDIFSTAKTTGTNVMLCGNDGTPDGHISFSNLINKSITYITDNAQLGNGYAVCSTAGSTAAKEVIIPSFVLKTNCFVGVLFQKGFATSGSTLKVKEDASTDITTNIAIKWHGQAIPMHKVQDSTILTMQYDGTDFNVMGIDSSVAFPSVNFVDLGLTSGTKWATMNVGAATPEDYGLYFSFGNADGHTSDSGYSFDATNYAGSPGSTVPANSSYAANETYDGARKNMGAPWRVPSDTEYQELIDGCTKSWVTQNGVAGMRFTGSNGNAIFIPAAGYISGTNWSSAGSQVRLWTNFKQQSGSRSLYVLIKDDGSVSITGSNNPAVGFTLRPVQ